MIDNDRHHGNLCLESLCYDAELKSDRSPSWSWKKSLTVDLDLECLKKMGVEAGFE